MTYSRRNIEEEQQEAYLQAEQLIAACEQLQITLDPIDWQHFGMSAIVKVNNIEIASLQEFRQRNHDAILRLVQIKLLEHAALEIAHARPGVKASMWSPVDVMPPQAFLSLWIITLETDERIPIIETIKNGQRLYSHFKLDGDDRQQLARLFGPPCEGEYHLGEIKTIKERDRQYTGKIIYIIPPGKALTNRKAASRGYHTILGTAYTNDMAPRYIVDCNDGFPHIVQQSQVMQETIPG